MTEEQYKEESKQIEQSYRKALKELAFKYVRENAKYKIGDIIKSDGDMIKIEKIGVYISLGKPDAMYSGIELTKQMTPKKIQQGRTVFGSWKDIELIKPQP